jgi:N-acetylglucosamine-6-phosphate deacetylase
LYDAADGLLKIVDVAPEKPGAGEFTEYAAKRCRVSAAHTDADYDAARDFFARGGRHLTQQYNCMPPLMHRAPGVIGAASERDDVTAELISDGYHVHESAVRAAFRLFPGRICLVSDSLRCCGMPDGEYTLGGQAIFLAGGVARLRDGTIAGAASDLYACLQKAISFGVPVEAAIAAATLNPAKALGLEKEIGSIAVGKRADFVVCDERYDRLRVYLDGAAVS